jgi:hypothetical protein
MSENNASGVSTAAPTDLTPTPTTTHYQEVAAALSATLTTALSQIPSFEVSHPATVKFVRAHQGFPNDFIATVLAAVAADPQLQNVNKFDVAEARDTLQFLEAFRSVIDQTQVLLDTLKFTCASRKARVVADGLQIYLIAQGIGRDPGSAAVATYVEHMKRDLKRNRRRSRTANPAPTPAPQTAPQ